MSARKSDLDWLEDYIIAPPSLSPVIEERGWMGGLITDMVGKLRDGVAASSFWTSRFWEDDDRFERGTLDLMEVLKSVHRTANVVSNSSGEERTLEVAWAKGTEVNTVTTDTVYLSPSVVDPEYTRKPKWSGDERQDVLVAETLTEATLRKTVAPDVEKAMLSTAPSESGVVTTGYPQKLKHVLWNTFERMFAETEVLAEYPGFRPYFAKARDYYTDGDSRRQIEEALTEAENVPSVYDALLWELMHPGDEFDVSPKARGALVKAVTRAVEAETSEDRAAAASRTVEHFMELWPWNEDEDKDPHASLDPDDFGGDGSKSRPAPPGKPAGAPVEPGAGRKFSSKLDWEDTRGLQFVESPATGTPKTPRDVAVAVEGEYDETHDPGASLSWADLCTWKEGTDVVCVRADGDSRATYQEALTRLLPQVNALRTRLKFRSEEQKLTEHGLRRGRLDEGSMHKLCFAKTYGLDDPYLFEAEEILAPPAVAFLVLVDESGSMSSGGRAKQARDCAIVIANAVKHLPGVDVAVMGHTGQGGFDLLRRRANGLGLHQYFTPENPEIEALGHIRAYAQNLDGYAIGQATQRLLRWYPHHDAHVVVHISDGEPAGNGYGGYTAMKHIRKVGILAAGRGVRVVGVGIDNAFSKESGKMMYGTGNFTILSGSNAYHAVSNLLVDAVHAHKDIG